MVCGSHGMRLEREHLQLEVKRERQCCQTACALFKALQIIAVRWSWATRPDCHRPAAQRLAGKVGFRTIGEAILHQADSAAPHFLQKLIGIVLHNESFPFRQRGIPLREPFQELREPQSMLESLRVIHGFCREDCEG